jgi:hypothetical protein
LCKMKGEIEDLWQPTSIREHDVSIKENL